MEVTGDQGGRKGREEVPCEITGDVVNDFFCFFEIGFLFNDQLPLPLRKVFAFICLFVAFLFGCSSEVKDYSAVTSNPEFIHRSIKQVTDRIVHDIFSPPVASRIYTYTSVAGYEAVRHADPN